MEYLMVGIGGVLGAVARYGIGKWAGRRWAQSFPLATFCINIFGSFILGLLYMLLSGNAGVVDRIFKPFATTGFLGAFTTYSTFSLEIVNLLEDGQKTVAVTYFLASLTAGLAAAYLGMLLGQTLIVR